MVKSLMLGEEWYLEVRGSVVVGLGCRVCRLGDLLSVGFG